MIKSFSGSNSFLSNFYSSPLTWEGMEWPTAEHAYQAAKTLDMKEREAIRQAKTPSQAKRMGREVTLRADWEEVKVATMESILWQKFQRKTLADLLLSTGNESLVEGNNWHDNFWGQCQCIKCANDSLTGNNLGMLLMKIRKLLRIIRRQDSANTIKPAVRKPAYYYAQRDNLL